MARKSVTLTVPPADPSDPICAYYLCQPVDPTCLQTSHIEWYAVAADESPISLWPRGRLELNPTGPLERTGR